MSTYNIHRFTPGNKGNMRLFMNKEYLRQYYAEVITKKAFNKIITSGEGSLCDCVPQQANKGKQGWNDSLQPENIRISKMLTGTLGGKITYGNLNTPATLNYLGGWEGQPGGSFKPLRNKF